MRVNVTKLEKYVNMTDINIRPAENAMPVALVELLFFAYRDFVSDPDAMLASLGFGRAHHRVVHFIGRSPGMTVAQLLNLLQITKQSLSRVLKELIDKGFVYQLEGDTDRRQRLLHLTPAGRELHQRLMAPQIARITRAVTDVSGGNSEPLRALLFNLISPENREDVTLWLAGAGADDGGSRG
jgi:DNA-binding MarR family transcriptional regulator